MAKPWANVPAAEPHRAAAWLQALVEKTGGALASVFLPAGCRLCEQLLTTASRLPICGECLASFSLIRDPVCDLCGLPLESAAENYGETSSVGQAPGKAAALCIGCRADALHFDSARSFARYEDSLVRAIVLLKFEEMDPLADWFADRLAETARRYAKETQADLIVPVPLHKIRRRERGFNQA